MATSSVPDGHRARHLTSNCKHLSFSYTKNLHACSSKRKIIYVKTISSTATAVATHRLSLEICGCVFLFISTRWLMCTGVENPVSKV